MKTNTIHSINANGQERIVSRLEAKANPRKSFNSITDDDIERARELPIEEMFEGELFRAGGKRQVGRCPWHNNGNERTPSFYIFQDNNRYKCFGCDEGGDAISFFMKQHGMGVKEFPKAIRLMINK